MKISGRKNKLGFVVAIIGLLIFFQWIGLLGWFENGLRTILKPSLKVAYITSSKLNPTEEEKLSKAELRKLFEETKKENNQLQAENAQLRYLQKENKTLREYAGFFERTKYKHVIADVISRNTIDNNFLQSSNIIVNRGSNDGIVEGLLVINQSGIVVGKVTQVNKNIAEVSLITSKRCSLAVSLQNELRTTGITKGNAGLTVSIDFIPQTEKIEVGNLVVTSGLENNIPRGMIIGKVSKVIKENNEIWQKAIIEPAFDLEELRIVSIILPQVQF